jgi:O-antigen ligase
MPPPTPTNPWPTRLLAAAAASAAVVTLAHPSSTRQFTWPWVLWLALIWLAPIAALLVVREPWLRPGRLLASGLLLLGLATLASAACSPFAALSLLRIWPALGGVALFFWLHHWLACGDSADRARRVARGLAVFGAVLAAVSLVGWRWQSAGNTWLVRNDIPFGHSNYTAGAMLLVIPWFVHAAWQTRGLRQFAWGTATVAGYIILITTSSRAGALALGAASIMAVAITIIRAPWPRRTKGLLVVIAAAALALVVLANPRLRELALSSGWSDSARDSNTQRNAMLQAGIQLGAERPLLGWGPGTVPLAYPLVRAQLDAGVDNVLQLHSTPVQLWATLGSAGILALLLLLAATTRQLWKVAHSSTPLTLTAGASLLTYALFALTDHQLDLPALNALLVLNLALLFCRTNPPATLKNSNPPGYYAQWDRLLSLTAVLPLLVPLWLTGRDLTARLAYEQSLSAFETGRGPEGMMHLEAAVHRAPYDPYYRHQLAGRLLVQRTAVADATVRARLDTEAAEQLRLSLAAGCMQEFAHFNLAWLALESGAPRLAATHFRSTLAQAPHRGGAYFGLGLALLAAHENAAAVRAFALEWVNDPTAALSPVWASPDFVVYRPSVAREAEAILAELTPKRAAAAYISALWRWWEQGGPPPARGFNRESDLFITALAALTRGQPLPSTIKAYPWGRLLATWRQPPADFSVLTPRDPAFATALALRAARHPSPDAHGFLTAGPEGAPNLLLDIRPARTGYGVLALHPDGPVLTDLYVKPASRIVSAFASTVFPPKGWLPARELLARLPAAPPTP